MTTSEFEKAKRELRPRIEYGRLQDAYRNAIIDYQRARSHGDVLDDEWRELSRTQEALDMFVYDLIGKAYPPQT